MTTHLSERLFGTKLAAVCAALLLAVTAPATAATRQAPSACANGYVGLTYDDGPTASETTALLNALRSGGAKATFFIWGAHADQYPNLLRSEQQAGMWIGNHTYTHPHLTQIGEPAAYQEIARAQQTIRTITGLTPTLFRPPYGETSAQVHTDEARLGLTEVLWTADSRDWAGASTAQIVQAAATLQPGGIILMHDGYATTVNAVSPILSGLTGRGLCPGKIVYSAALGRAVAVAP